MKAMLIERPKRLNNVIKQNVYTERRRPDRYKFYSSANLRIGDQSLTNWAGSLMNELDFDWAMGLSYDQIRVKLKRHFGMAKQVGEGFFPLGWGAKC